MKTKRDVAKIREFKNDCIREISLWGRKEKQTSTVLIQSILKSTVNLTINGRALCTKLLDSFNKACPKKIGGKCGKIFLKNIKDVTVFQTFLTQKLQITDEEMVTTPCRIELKLSLNSIKLFTELNERLKSKHSQTKK